MAFHTWRLPVSFPRPYVACPARPHSLGLSTSTSTCTGTCGFIHGKTCTYRSHVCRYLALKLPMSTGVDFGMSKYSQSTHAHAQLGALLGTRLSCHLKICRLLSSTLLSPHPHGTTSLMFNMCKVATPTLHFEETHPH